MAVDPLAVEGELGGATAAAMAGVAMVGVAMVGVAMASGVATVSGRSVSAPRLPTPRSETALMPARAAVGPPHVVAAAPAAAPRSQTPEDYSAGMVLTSMTKR